MRFQAAVFDLDGTLLNTLGDLTDACNHVCGRNGWPVFTEDQVGHMVGNGIAKLVERFTPEVLRTPETLDAALAEFTAYYGAHKADRTAPYPGTVRALAALRAAGMKTAVLSNKADALCRPLVSRYFGDVFDVVRGKVDGVPAKPDPTSLRAVLRELDVTAEDAVYVGDSDVDVLTGHNAGLAVCGAEWGFRGREELTRAGADLLAGSMTELAALLLDGTAG